LSPAASLSVKIELKIEQGDQSLTAQRSVKQSNKMRVAAKAPHVPRENAA
jgi:hypothetical protein